MKPSSMVQIFARSNRKFSRDLHSFLIVGQVSLLAGLFALLYYHSSTLGSYLVISSVIAVLSGLAILRDLSNRFVFVHGFILFLAVRLIYYFATDFRSIPFGDPYWDLGVVKTFLSTNQLSVIDNPFLPPRMLTWYSSWPLMHAFEVTVIQATGLNVEAFHMLFAFFISSLTFVFAFLFIKQVNRVLKLRSNFLYLAVVFFAISPEGIYWGLGPTRQEFAVLILTVLIYLVSKGFANRKRGYTALSLLCIAALVLAHHFTSAVAAGVFVGLAILFPPRQFKGPYVTLAGVLVISVLLWWTGYGRVIFEAPSISFFSSDFLNFNPSNLRPATYPGELIPPWLLPLLIARDVVLYATPAIGAFFLIKKKSSPNIRFVLILAASAALVFLLNVSVQALEPSRVIMMFMYVLTLFSAVGYSEVARRLKLNDRSIKIVMSTSLVLVVFAAMIGLWGHEFAPLHLYDNSINRASVGEKSPEVTNAKDFLANRINYDHVDKIVSEAHTSPLLDVPASQFGKIRTMLETIPVKDGKTLVLSTDNFFTYTYYEGFFADPQTRFAVQKNLENKLSSFDLTYSDGSNRVLK